jgi:hypothetical protein
MFFVWWRERQDPAGFDVDRSRKNRYRYPKERSCGQINQVASRVGGITLGRIVYPLQLYTTSQSIIQKISLRQDEIISQTSRSESDSGVRKTRLTLINDPPTIRSDSDERLSEIFFHFQFDDNSPRVDVRSESDIDRSYFVP